MPERALALLDEAEALDPYLPLWCVEDRELAFFAPERYREAIEHLSGAPLSNARFRLYQIVARMALGETEHAQKLARDALALQPDLTTNYVEKLVQRLIEPGVPGRH
jgi:adenylate cyclase